MALSKIDVANMLTGLVPNDNTIRRPNAKPLMINGDMAVAQRGTSFTSVSSGSNFPVDRFEFYPTNLGAYTIIQEALTSGEAYNNGFRTALRIDTTTADASPASTDYAILRTKFEGQDLQLFKKGTANAEKFTLAFWVKSNKTTTGQVNLFDIDNSRLVSGTYTISSANTWEKKVINFPADTTGAFDNNNALSLVVEFFLDGGSNFTSGTAPTAWEAQSNGDRLANNFAIGSSTDNDFAITGVQLEVGEYTSSTLPPFQHESFGDNLARCYRYYQVPVHNKDHQGTTEEYGAFNTGVYSADTYFRAARPLGVEMRANPTLVSSSGTNYFFILSGADDDINDLTLHNDSNFKTVWVYNNDEASSTSGQAGILMANNTSAYIAFDAEL
jgi:hypothetical protein